MNDNVECLILKQSDYRDHDAIVTVFTKEYGKLSFVVGGARKMSSKNAAFIIPYTKANFSFDFKENKTMFRLKTARTINFNRQIHEKIELSLIANIMVDVLDAFSLNGLENDSIEDEYYYLDESFKALENNEDPKTILFLYLIEMMKIFGISPDVDECVICGDKHITSISSKEGGFLCQKHSQEYGLKSLSNNDLKRFRLLVKAGLEHKDIVLSITKATMDDIKILEEIINSHSGLKIHSFNLYNQLFAV